MLRVEWQDCMKGNPAKAHVLYADVEPNDQAGRLIKASRIFTMKCFHFSLSKRLSTTSFMNLLFVDKNFNIHLEMKLS